MTRVSHKLVLYFLFFHLLLCQVVINVFSWVFLKELARCRARLVEVRARRPRPHLDDKIIVAWNALMISAYARAYQVFFFLTKGINLHEVAACTQTYTFFTAESASTIKSLWLGML